MTCSSEGLAARKFRDVQMPYALDNRAWDHGSAASGKHYGDLAAALSTRAMSMRAPGMPRESSSTPPS